MDCWGGELANETDSCSLNRSASSGIWSMFGTLWLFALGLCINALRRVRRIKPIQQKYEPRILFILSIASLSLCILGFLKAPKPSANPIGLDPASTTLFAIGTSLVFGFVAYSPINPAGLGIALFALQRKRALFRFYNRLSPLVMVATTVASFLPFIGLVDEPHLDIVISTTFGVFAFATLLSVSVNVYALQAMRNDFKTALRVKRQEVTESQKRGIEVIVESTGRMDLAIVLCASFVVITSLLIVIHIEPVMETCWLLIPAMLLVAWLWVCRYAIVSRQTTLKVLYKRMSRGISLNHPHGQNSISFTTSTSIQFQSPSLRRYNNILLSPSQMMTAGLPAATATTTGGNSSNPNGVPSSSNLTSETTKKNDRPRKSWGSKKNKRKSGVSRMLGNNFLLANMSAPTKFLTRVDEVENEGTIVSKYDYDWANNSSNPPNPTTTGTTQGAAPVSANSSNTTPSAS